jgi:hypothetical protein
MPAQDNPSSGRNALLPYRELSEDDYAQRAADRNFVLDVSEPGFPILRGTCPRCGHFMLFPVLEEVYKAVRPENEQKPSPAKGGTKGKEQTEPMICTCEEEHPGRPAEAEGCGAYWKLLLTFEPR